MKISVFLYFCVMKDRQLFRIVFCVLLLILCVNFGRGYDKVSNILKFKMRAENSRSAKMSLTESNYFYVQVCGYDCSFAEKLQKHGIEIEAMYGNVAYCRLSANLIHELSEVDWIKKIDVPHKMSLSMDIVREATSVDIVQEGFEFQKDIIPFKGDNVVIGIVDCGIDPFHTSFMSSDSNSSRIGRYSVTKSGYENGSNGFEVVVSEGVDELDNAVPENLCGGHGTHVAGISSGRDVGNGYYGIAPQSELVLTTMGEHIYEDEVLYGIHSSIEYADERGLPVVVNLSLGSAIGPHDGEGAVTDYLSSISKEGHIVCFAAGNDGGQQISLNRDFEVYSQELSSAFARRGYGTPPESVYSQMWSSDETEFEIAFHVVDIVNKKVLFTTPYLSRTLTNGATDNVVVLYSSDNPYTSEYPELGEYFTGEVLYATSNENNRYVGEILGMFDGVDIETPYTLGFSIKSEAGANVMVISDFECCYLRHYGLDGFVNGDANNSISDYCTSPYVVSVGSWNAREGFVDAEGICHELNENSYGSVGSISRYSSYGENVMTGEMLPHVVAPGTEVISSLNINATDINKETYVCSEVLIEEETYAYGNMTGTSMAVPVASGILALWLEAKPDLTRDEILTIMRNSSQRDSHVEEDYYRAGAGKIDAYAGLKYILTSMGSTSPKAYDEELKFMIRYLSNEEIEVVLTEFVDQATIRFYNLVGQIVGEYDFTGNQIRVPMKQSSGYYLMKISTEKQERVEKIYIK